MMKSESFFSRYSFRLDVKVVSPSVHTPMTKASRRPGNRKTSIWEELLAAMHSPSRPGRFSPPDIAINSLRVKLVIGASVALLFMASLDFRQI